MLLRRLLASLLGGSLLLAGSGCSPVTVTEDRSINYSTQGTGVAFQHGEDGVFVASSDGQSLERIFDSTDALAVSSPLWSPVDGRLIFTTAHAAEPEQSAIRNPSVAWDANPEGRDFRPQEVMYTCWVRDEPADGEQPEPTALFTARVDHPGYIAANLAVRWHPSGERILFIDQVQGDGVSLFEFDLSSMSIRRLIEHRANALVFDWSPNYKHLACSLLGIKGNRSLDGIWLSTEEESAWWRVPESDWKMPLKTVVMLDRLRATRPAWTDDDQHFAFVSIQERQNEAPTASIYRATPATRSVTELHQSDEAIRDLRWHPNSQQLAFVEGVLAGSLRMIDAEGNVSQRINEFDVRYFAGWNHDASELAYISPVAAPEHQSQWVLLFPAVPAARDRVYVADGKTGAAARLVHDDVRITFPQWSPTQNELSLWGTYAPTHSSWLSMILPWTLRPGDPAAILDCETGEIRWMAINSHEQSQVGHYYLLKREYEQAWRWYEMAAKNRPTAEAIKLSDFAQLMQQRRIYQDPTFFEYYCLSKLGRVAESEARLAQFRRSLTLEWDDADTELLWFQVSSPEAKAQLQEAIDFIVPLIQSAYMAEVFLSLHAAEDGAVFFAQQTAAATTDAQRFASLVCQSQLLLANEAHEEYAELVTYQLAPVLERLVDLEVFSAGSTGGELTDWAALAKQFVVAWGGGLAALPMASPEFIRTLPEHRVRQWLADWQVLRTQATRDEPRLAADLVIHALLDRLGDGNSQEVRERIDTNPLMAAGNAQRFGGDVDQLIDEIRGFSQPFPLAR